MREHQHKGISSNQACASLKVQGKSDEEKNGTEAHQNWIIFTLEEVFHQIFFLLQDVARSQRDAT